MGCTLWSDAQYRDLYFYSLYRVLEAGLLARILPMFASSPYAGACSAMSVCPRTDSTALPDTPAAPTKASLQP